jgi:YVTN family beta-propeller protein
MTNSVKWRKQGYFLTIGLTLACFASLQNAVLGNDPESSASDQKGPYHILRKVKLGGEGSWDYLNIDSIARRLYIGRSNRITIVDIDNDKVIGEIGEMEGVHGVTLVPELKKGFVTCGKQDLVKIIDLCTLKVSGEIKTGKKPDASLYDPHTKRVFVFNNGGTTTTVIDVASEKVLANLEIGGAPESGATDGAGKIYVNLEDKSEIAVIDANALKVLSHWSLAPGEEPTGLAIDTNNHRLFSGCHNKLMIVMNSETGKVIGKLPIGKGVDAAAFAPTSHEAFASNGDGTLSVVLEKDANTFSVVQNLAT